jgi:hypothetical protein
MAPFSHVNNMQQPPELSYQRVTYIPLCVREDEASIPSRPTANTFVEPQQFHVVNNNHILRQVPHFRPRNFIISLYTDTDSRMRVSRDCTVQQARPQQPHAWECGPAGAGQAQAVWRTCLLTYCRGTQSFWMGSTSSSPPTIGGPAVRYPNVVYLQLLYGTLTHETVAVRQKRLGGPDRGPRSAV